MAGSEAPLGRSLAPGWLANNTQRNKTSISDCFHLLFLIVFFLQIFKLSNFKIFKLANNTQRNKTEAFYFWLFSPSYKSPPFCLLWFLLSDDCIMVSNFQKFKFSPFKISNFPTLQSRWLYHSYKISNFQIFQHCRADDCIMGSNFQNFNFFYF